MSAARKTAAELARDARLAAELELALFPTVALELARPVRLASGGVFAGAGAVVLARGRERGRWNEVHLTQPGTRREAHAALAELAGARVLADIPL